MSAGRLHIYAAGHQPATRFDLGAPSGYTHMVLYRDRRLVCTRCCGRLRWAGNCTVQVYYDDCPFWCKPGKGCRA